MKTNRKLTSDNKGKMDFSRIEKLHPYKTFLFFGLVGSTVLFLSVSFLYFVTVSRTIQAPGLVFPKSFSVSTVLILLSSYWISKSAKSFREDAAADLKSSLIITLVLSIAFCVSQFFGWKQLYDQGFFMNSNVGVAYLFLISGIHFAHVLGGMIYLAYLTYGVYHQTGDMVKSLLYFSDERNLLSFQLAQVYWHFVDFLWVMLYFMFLFTF